MLSQIDVVAGQQFAQIKTATLRRLSHTAVAMVPRAVPSTTAREYAKPYQPETSPRCETGTWSGIAADIGEMMVLIAACMATQLISSAGSDLNVGYRRYADPVFTSATPIFLARNCLGGPADISTDLRVESIFDLTGTELRCAGNSAAAQPIIQNVANFQVRYLLQDVTTTLGSPQIRYADAATVGTNWNRVQGVEVCLVLFGTETVSMPAGSSYLDCDGTTSVNMTTLTGARANRMHMVFRNVFQLRSQGLF